MLYEYPYHMVPTIIIANKGSNTTVVVCTRFLLRWIGVGVTPLGGMAPVVGHFHTMLEAARTAKTNEKNAGVGDLGQRLRLTWKQTCLVDQGAGAYVKSKVGKRRKKKDNKKMITKKCQTMARYIFSFLMAGTFSDFIFFFFLYNY